MRINNKKKLLSFLRSLERCHILEPESLHAIEGIIQLNTMQVREIMTPKSQISMLDTTSSSSKCLANIIKLTYSRFPVLDIEKDQVIGLILAQEVLAFLHPNANKDIQHLVRDILFVQESKRLDSLLSEFKATGIHMAIVLDEYGNTAGLITFNDIVEQIIGEVQDEHTGDEEENDFIKKLIDKNKNVPNYIVKASTPISYFNQYFDSSMDTKDSDTIGGIVLRQFNHIPLRGDVAVVDKFNFTVLKSDLRRVHLLQVDLLSE